MKARFFWYDNKSADYILQEFETKKVVKARNFFFRESEIQSFSLKEENLNLVSPNMDFEDDRSNDEDTIMVGKMIQRHMLFKISLKSKKTLRRKKHYFPEKAEIVAHRQDMDYTTPLTQPKEEDVQEPKSYNETINSTQAKNWRKTMNMIHKWTIILGH